MLLLLNRSVIYGSDAGHWRYPYVPEAPGPMLQWAVVSFIATAGLAWLSSRLVERVPFLVVAGWIVLAFLFHTLMRDLAPISLAKVVASDSCMSFYSVARQYSPLELLRHFDTLAPRLPDHARTNMPGKTLLIHAMLPLGASAEAVGAMIVALADLGGALIYAVAWRLYRSRQAALLALILYLVIPAKDNFFPLMNVISPLFAFAALWLLLVYLDHQRTWLLALVGVSLYLLFAFEPLPFTLGLIFVGVLVQRFLARGITWRSWLLIPGVVTAGFLTTHVLAKLCLGFDAIRAFLAFLDDAVDFNRRLDRPYEIWVTQNLPEFFIGAGAFASLLTLSAWFQLATDFSTSRRASGWLEAARSLLCSRGESMLTFLLLTLLTVDLLGVNRGEVTRLWIFIAVALQVAVADFSVRRYGWTLCCLAVGASAMQSVVSTTMIEFLNCK